jgi:hypothetical protein
MSGARAGRPPEVPLRVESCVGRVGHGSAAGLVNNAGIGVFGLRADRLAGGDPARVAHQLLPVREPRATTPFAASAC